MIAASNPNDLPWCVIQTAANRERDVQADLWEAGWVTYLPLEIVSHMIGGKRRDVRRPLFPRYLFAACMPRGDVAAAREIRGLVAVRRRADGGSVVRPRLMLAMQLAEISGGFDRRPKPKVASRAFKAGQSALVVEGVLFGWEARIVKVLSKREVVAAVSLFGRDVEMTFAAAHLDAA